MIYKILAIKKRDDVGNSMQLSIGFIPRFIYSNTKCFIFFDCFSIL